MTWQPGSERIRQLLDDGQLEHANGRRVVEIGLVNAQTEPAANKDTAWLFQPKLTVTAAVETERAVFCSPASNYPWTGCCPAWSSRPWTSSHSLHGTGTRGCFSAG